MKRRISTSREEYPHDIESEKSLFNLANFLLPLAKALALRTNIISQHRPKDEIFLRRKLAQWFGNDHTDSIQTFTLAKRRDSIGRCQPAE